MLISVLIKAIPTSATVILLSLLGTLTVRADPGVFDDRIVFGQSAALKGPAAALGLGMREGILAALRVLLGKTFTETHTLQRGRPRKGA